MFVSFNWGTVQACNAVLVSIEKMFPVAGWHVDFSRGEVTFYLKGLFRSVALRSMLEGKTIKVLILFFKLFGYLWRRLWDIKRMESCRM